jgi:GNAT superfamily N-acetyltransferase
MNIRQANSRDSLLLSSLCVDVQRLHAEQYPDLFKRPQGDDFAVSFFDEMLADPTVRIFLAEEDGRPIGYLMSKLFERAEGPFTYTNRFLQVEHISVHPDRQRQGVGTALMNRVEELAREIGVTKIQLDSWDFNTEAHTFFERRGFEKFNFRFWRRL